MLLFMATVLSSASTSPDPSAGPSGASSAFTSTDPLIVQARQLMESGEFTKAAGLLDSGHPADARAAGELREVIGRIRIAYATDADAMLATLKRSIPDVTAQDMERWAQGGVSCNPARSTGGSGTSIVSLPTCSASAMR